ncbi:MAG: hypothetical protein CME06_11030 [Gemmatimonadetes bacterium]|nr:hypothetical protein [Gemmatimonadota bacterium]
MHRPHDSHFGTTSTSFRAPLAGAFALALIWAGPGRAWTINVPADMLTIQAAIDTIAAGDTVMVHPGNYAESIDFGGKSIVVTGTAPDELDTVKATVIDAGGLATVVSFQSGEDEGAVLAGLTLTGGRGAPNGGGVNCDGASPTLDHCVIIANSAAESGGGVSGSDASPTLSDCIIDSNFASTAQGGGFSFSGSSNPTFVRCLIARNHAATRGGGGACSDGTEPSLSNSVVFFNTADGRGGGLAVGGSGAMTLTNCAISENLAEAGSGIDVRALGALMIDQVTVAGNVANPSGGAILLAGEGSIGNSVLWGNSPDEIMLEGAGSADVRYTDVRGSYSGEGNLDVDPNFALYFQRGYPLRAGSPCIDAADPAVEDGIWDAHPSWPAPYSNGVRADMGAYGGPGNADWIGFLALLGR